MEGFRKIKRGAIIALPYRMESKYKNSKLRNKDLAILLKVISVEEDMKENDDKTIIHWKKERKRSIV